ncbi:MAG: translation initiation factor IF-2 [Spirochaetes bacterium]|nr:translation initiation factor IF-2 [Spirochaetota bacterium]
MNKKIITYLKEKNFTIEKINEILSKYNWNPEDRLVDEIISIIDREYEELKKPIKKIKIKKKIIKKVVKTSLSSKEDEIEEETAQELEEDKKISTAELIEDNVKDDEGKVKLEDLEKKEEDIKEKIKDESGQEIVKTYKFSPKTDYKKIKEEPQESNISSKSAKEPSYKGKNFKGTPQQGTKTLEPSKKLTFSREFKKSDYDNKIDTKKEEQKSFGDHKKKIFIKKKKESKVIDIQKKEFSFSNKQTSTQPTKIGERKEPPRKFTEKGKKKEVEYQSSYEDENIFNQKISASLKKKEEETKFNIPSKIEIPETITVSELAKKMNIKSNMLIKKFFEMGKLVTINQIIDAETAEIVVSEFGTQVIRTSIADEIKIPEQNLSKQDIRIRPPIVTIMGHVDHGKTSLLDYIRKSKITATEAGGITQKIGAYKVDVKGKSIVFIDTPGHEAFANMRARGAKVTDIVILVVAADDGVMPQTKEAINHAREANVPIIVAINKIDKHNANPDKVKGELAEFNLIPQEWGGDTLFFNISALKGIGVDDLLEGILLLADSLNLKADFYTEKWGSGYILESRIDKGRGVIATVILKDGVVKLKQFFVSGKEYGKVRSMIDDKGKSLKIAYPGDAVEIIGFEGLPEPGDEFNIVDNEDLVKEISKKRKEYEVLKKSKKSSLSLDSILKQMDSSEVKELKIILNADVNGMVEALSNALEKLSVKEVKVKVIQKSVGAIKESDVNLAIASKAIIIGFNTKPTPEALKLAESEGVEIRRYNIIYDAIEDIKSAISGLAAPKIKEEIIGEIEVRQLFKVPNVGTVAGSYVTKGKVVRGALCRIYRDHVKIYESKIASLFRFKDPVKEVKQGFECGISIENFNDINVGDIIEVYQNIEEAISFEELKREETEELQDKEKKE